MTELAQVAAETVTTEAPLEQPKAEPKPSETVDYWKQKSRQNEAQAKANADAARRLSEIEDAQKSAEQKAVENAAQAQRDLDAARSETLRYKAAATHRVSEGNFDLLGSGAAEEIEARAQRVGVLEAALAERDQLKAELEALRGAAPSPPRPVDQLKPGAAASVVDDSYPASWFPGSRTKST